MQQQKRAAMAMKFLAAAGVLAFWVRPAAAVQFRGEADADTAVAADGTRTVTEVVQLLQTMLDKSREEAQSERDLYTKYKCYCDDNEKEKTEAIAKATKNIKLLGSEVEELLGSNAELSQEVAKLQADMDTNEQVRTTSDTLRSSEKNAFDAEETDLDAAVTQLGKAIAALAAIGGDQSMASAAHNNFMAGYGGKDKAELMGLRTSVNRALLAAGAVLDTKQRVRVETFLQQQHTAPFTGSYVAQSGEVVGILKQMKETFESNLVEARAAEAAAIKAQAAFIKTKESEHETMKKARDSKYSTMGANDGDLGSKKQALSSEIESKESDEEFLVTLTDSCAKKAKDYEKRQEFRTTEEAAISEAIAILNSDAAFNTFGKVTATTFLQVGAVPHGQVVAKAAALEAGAAARTVLQQAAIAQKSSRLAHIAGLLALGNPFTKVLAEIEKVKKVLDAEGKQDLETKNWCDTERTNSDASIDSKKKQITDHNSDITQLNDDIDNPDTGLKASITEKESTLEKAQKTQIDETKSRRAENLLYQTTIGNCVEAGAILKQAISLLKTYYATLAAQKAKYNAELVQEDPAPPQTWDGEFKGQETEGSNVISVLDTILTNTVTEENSAHDAEVSAQHSYEDLMQGSKDLEEKTQDELVKAKKDLAQKEEELMKKRVDLENTEKEKLAVERYLEEIKPGCDFITTNLADRDAARAKETAALDKAVSLLEASPAFAAAKAKDKEEGFGDCKDICNKDEKHADCQACLAKVSVPGYCAGHAGTPGC